MNDFLCVKSQNINGAVIVGGNFSQVDGDEVYGFNKFGINIGASAIIPLKNNKWSIILENVYSQKGAYKKLAPVATDSIPYYKLNLDYVEVPVLIQYNDKNVFSFGSGFSWGRLVNFKEVEHGQLTSWTTPNGPYKRDDIQLLADLRFRLSGKFHFNIRYAYSIAKIRTRTYITQAGNPWERRQFHNLVTLRVIYIFNEKIPKD